MLYILYGEDDFLLKEAVKRIKAEHEDGLGETNTTLLEGEKLSLAELIATCNTMPFLAPKRLVFVEGLLSRFEGKQSSPELKEWDGLIEYVHNMPASTILVLIDGKLAKSNPLLKGLARKAEVKEFAPLKGVELQKWIRSRVVERGGKISPSASQLLADLIGSNLWILSNEIEKLCLYTKGRRIEESDITLLVSYAKEANIFVMADAIAERRLKMASRLLHQLLEEGSAPPYLLYMITRQFRLLIQAKQLIAQRVPLDLVGNKIGVSSEFVLEKVVEQARKHSLRRLAETYRKLLDTDLAIKTGALQGELALDLLLTELCRE